LLAITGAVLAAGLPRAPGVALAVALAAWTLGTAHGQSLYMLGWRYHRPLPYVPLTELRGGLLVPVWEAAEYERIFGLLASWQARTVVAGPDSPEVYYLGERPLPDREFFEFMAPEWSAAAFARRIATHHPDAVVLNRRPGFSRVDVDSVVALLPWRPIADTTTGRFRLLRFAPAHASP
ncbi:MAG TPA: hypothetical protein VFS07_00995, partial [Gemmatimonadales bacterium]|nr:hypothetical protein [Gemmatimonadales bacterium]